MAAVAAANCLRKPAKSRRFLYNTVGESTSRKRAVYRMFAPECQTQFPGRQTADEAFPARRADAAWSCRVPTRHWPGSGSRA